MKVVIIGSGYVGVWAYRALTRWLGRGVDITVITKTNHHSYHGFIGEVIGGNLEQRYTSSALRECFAKAQHVIGEATQVNPIKHEVTVQTETGYKYVTYDQLIVATGGIESTSRVPGLTEHGWRLRTPGNPSRLVHHIQQGLPDIPATTHTAANTVVIIGAGFTGTESAAALKRRFGDRINVILVFPTATVINTWQHKKMLQRHLLRNLTETGVELRPNSRVADVTAQGVTLTDGTFIAADNVVAALGNDGVQIPGLEAYLCPKTGLYRVDSTLTMGDDIWSAGDAAAVKTTHETYAVKDALWALNGGTRIGRNIARVAKGKNPRRFGFMGLGSVATFGTGSTVGVLMGLPIAGLHAYIIRMAFFLWYVPSRKNALRIFASFWRNRNPKKSARSNTQFQIPEWNPLIAPERGHHLHVTPKTV